MEKLRELIFGYPGRYRVRKPQGIRVGIIEFKSGMVCVRSFFDGSIARAYKMRRVWATAAAALSAIAVLTVTLMNSILCLAVYVNGEEVGRAKNITDVTKIVTSAEEQLTEILGYEYSLADSLTFTADIAVGRTAEEDIERAILSSIDCVEEKSVLLVGGRIVGACDDENELYVLLDGILQDYTTEAATSIRFLEDIAIERQFVSDEVVSDLQEIAGLIAPSNAASGVGLTVECTETTLLTEEIPFETVNVDDETMYLGDSQIISEGVSGARQFTQTVTIINGVEVSRERSGELVVTEPVTQLVSVGTAPRPRTASYGFYIWPADGTLTSRFGPRTVSIGSSYHKGLDIAGSYGQAVNAADGGEVIFAGWNSSYGYVVKIRHDNGEVTLYAHNSSLLVEVGQRVAQGEQIARMGSTGVSSGTHCHFEIIVKGVQVNPMPFLQ